MAWFRRRRRPSFDPLDERIERRVELAHTTDDRPTAAEAVALALPIARTIDSGATLRMVVGSAITEDGRSHTWDVLCDGRSRLAALSVQLVVGIDLEGHVDHAQLLAIPKLPDAPDSFMRPLWERLDDGPVWTLTVGRDEATRRLT